MTKRIKLLLALAVGLLAAGCVRPPVGIPVPFNDGNGGNVVLCSTLPNGHGYFYATNEAGGCEYPLTDPAHQATDLWCKSEPTAVTSGDPLCAS